MKMTSSPPASKLFEYSDNDNDHFIDDDKLNEDSRRIEEAASRKKACVRRHKGALLMGGPEEPDYCGMTAVEANMAREKFELERKRWREGKLLQQLWAQKTKDFKYCRLFQRLNPYSAYDRSSCGSSLAEGSHHYRS